MDREIASRDVVRIRIKTYVKKMYYRPIYRLLLILL